MVETIVALVFFVALVASWAILPMRGTGHRSEPS